LDIDTKYLEFNLLLIFKIHFPKDGSVAINQAIFYPKHFRPKIDLLPEKAKTRFLHGWSCVLHTTFSFLSIILVMNYKNLLENFRRIRNEIVHSKRPKLYLVLAHLFVKVPRPERTELLPV